MHSLIASWFATALVQSRQTFAVLEAIISLKNTNNNHYIDSEIIVASSALCCNWYNFILASNCSLICL
jgi:hypothetical protein